MLAAAMAVNSAGCFDRDDDDLDRSAAPGAPIDRDDEERGIVYDPPADERIDESVEPETDEGLDPQIDEHFDSRLRRRDRQ